MAQLNLYRCPRAANCCYEKEAYAKVKCPVHRIWCVKVR